MINAGHRPKKQLFASNDRSAIAEPSHLVQFEMPSTIEFSGESNQTTNQLTENFDQELQTNLNKIISQNKTLKESNFKKDQIISHNLMQISDSQQELKKSRAELKDLNIQLRELIDSQNSAKASIKNTEAHLKKEKQTSDGLRYLLKRERSKNDVLLEQYKKENGILLIDLNRIKKSNELIEQEIEKARSELNCALDTHSEFQIALSNKEFEINRIKSELSCAHSSYEKEKEEVKTKEDHSKRKMTELEMALALAHLAQEELEKNGVHWKNKFFALQSEKYQIEETFDQEKKFLLTRQEEKNVQSEIAIEQLKYFHNLQVKKINCEHALAIEENEKLVIRIKENNDLVDKQQTHISRLNHIITSTKSETANQISIMEAIVDAKTKELENLNKLYTESAETSFAAQKKLIELEMQNQRFGNSNENLQLSLAELNKKLSIAQNEFDVMNSRANQKNENLNSQLIQRDSKISELAQDVFELNEKISDVKSAHKVSIDQNLENEQMIKSLHVRLETLNNEIILQRQAVREKTEALFESNRIIESKVREYSQLKLDHSVELKDLKSATENSQNQVAELRSLNEDLELQVTTGNSQKTEIKNQIEKLIDEKNMAVDQNLLMIEQLNSNNAELIKAKLLGASEAQLLNVQIKKLNGIVNKLNTNKNQVKEFLKKIAIEIQSYGSLNPLVQILKVTEDQSLKIEVQLKKTPAIAFERPQLESYFQQLHEQKIFLKETIEHFNLKSNRQLTGLRHLFDSDELENSPPLPEIRL